MGEPATIGVLLSAIVEAIRQHGFWVTIQALLLAAVAIWMVVTLRRVSRQTGMVASRQHNMREIIRERIEGDARINDALGHLLSRLSADRCYVVQFHNGGENVCGIPFARFSRTHERVRPGVRALMTIMQGIPNSLFAAANLQLIRHREIAIPDVDAMGDADTVKLVYHEQSIRAVYLVSLLSFDGVPIGYLGVDFCRAAVDLDGEQRDSLNAAALKVCGLIMAGGPACTAECGRDGAA